MSSHTIDEVAPVARQCRHYAMCKIDALGTGLCPAGARFGFASYWSRLPAYIALV